jgi:PAS domain S-box-containing protein
MPQTSGHQNPNEAGNPSPSTPDLQAELAVHVQLQEDLRHRLEELEDLYNNAPCGYHSLDAEGRILRMNDTELGWLGYTRAELIGRRFIEVLTPEAVQLFRENFPRFKAQGWVKDLVFDMKRKDGTTFPASVNATAVYDAAGNYRMSRSTVFEISERKKIEASLELRVQERTAELTAALERYRILFESNPLPMWVYDPTTLRFLNVNEAAIQRYGYTPEEFLHMTVRDIRRPEDIPMWLAGMAQSPSERRLPRPSRHRTKSGALLDVEITALDLRLAGKAARLVIANDVTEKNQLEANLLRAQRLESLGTLAGGIAHDLNNVLSPLAMSVYLLRSKVADQAGGEILDTMDELIERGAHMIKQVLSFAQGSAGERVALNPKHVLREIISVLKETFPKAITLNSRVAEQLSSVFANPTQLHQVLMNLCVNARDALPHGGTLTITAENITLDEHYARMIVDAKPGNYVMMTVHDTGTGIAPHLLDKVFDPFFTTKEQGKGTGLGLATALGIVRNHQGFIQVYSELGVGTQFKVYLPALVAVQPPEEVCETPEPPSGAGELILLVDDEATILRIAKGTLEAFNYRVLTAMDGTEALALLMEHRAQIRLVLTDMMMPLMDGAATIRAIRKLHPQVPIIASSGLSEGKQEARALHAGAQMFLPKPYTAEKLLWSLAELLRQK